MALNAPKQLLFVGFVATLSALLLTSASPLPLSAQSPATQSNAQIGQTGTDKASQFAQRTFLFEYQPGSQNCPVSMYVQQKGMSDVIKVRRGQDTAPSQLSRPGQRIRLELGNSTLSQTNDDRKVISAKVLIKGTSARSRKLNAMADSSGTAEKTRILEVQFTTRPENKSATNLTLDGFTSISSISLLSITYSGGATWAPSETSACRTAPDPLVLIDGLQIHESERSNVFPEDPNIRRRFD